MNGMASRFARFGFALLGVVIVGWVLTGQAAKHVQQGIPLPTDWSHRHLIFSQPATVEQARLIGNEPRYWQQVERLRQRVLLRDETSGAPLDRLLEMASGAGSSRTIHRDWSADLGAGGSVGAGNYPAKFSFHSTTANCATDYVVFSTGLAGAVNQASIVAFNNLYSGCGGTVPSVMWAYNTSQIAPPVPGTISTSPVLSRDGTQIAFVQTDGIGAAKLVLLKWAASAIETVALPGVPLPVLPAAYPLCVAPCMTTFDLRDRTGVATDDTTSSIFVDYSADTAWVGDSSGLLHKFNPFFKATPAESRPPGIWPLLVTGGVDAGSPVHDFVSGNVFVGGVVTGSLYRVDPGTGAVTASSQLDFGAGLVAGPIVDSTNGTVYVSVSADGTGACTGGTTDCAGVIQLATNFAAGDPGIEAGTGISSLTPNPMYDGFFDNTYLSSANGTGNFYVCGNTGANPILYRIPITANAFGTPVAVSTLTSAASISPCSPVTDVANANTTGGASERVFVSVQNNGRPTACAGGGCVINFVDMPWQSTKAFTVGQEILVLTSVPNLSVNVVTQAGTSGATSPTWPTTAGVAKIDGTVHWLNQGPITAIPLASWQPGHLFTGHSRILDGNGNVEVESVAGTSGAAAPPFAITPGATTTDGATLVWINAGPLPTAALPAAGGTSAIIIDNTVGAGTLAGASQVYFSTLANQPTCTGGAGGCAVQASQPALQ